MTEKNEQEKIGITNLKEGVALGFKAGEVLKISKESGGKIDFNDAPNLLMLAPVLGPAIDDADMIPKEIADLDESEARELMDFAKQELGELLSEQELIAKINASLDWIVATVRLVRAWA